jgi:amino acid adenylation domain-containing protein
VIYEEERLSYRELEGRANQLANHLRTLGVGPDSVVGLYLERSAEMIVGLLGILKAGGAYLPLEVGHPVERLGAMLEDAGARVVVTKGNVAGSLPAGRHEAVLLDRDWEQIAGCSQAAPESEVELENLAYVIYTSGSTGAARGVMVEHRALLNLAISLHEKVYADNESPLRVSLNAPLVFDSSVKQLAQLLYGHALCIIPEDVRRDGDELLSYLRLHEVDVLDCTPFVLRALLASGLSERPGGPSLALVGGEAIDQETWSRLADSAQTTFFNVYGPTECTVDASVRRIGSLSRSPSLGRPIGNVQIYLLDKQRRPVPIGVPGELCIGGAGLARGYLSQPDLTAERFAPDPFGPRAGARLYASGDLARYRADGEIEFLGRLDYQVKIRGYRIELGEIETALRKNPQVLHAVVLDRETIPGEKQLVAYIVPAQNSTASIAELQRGLKEHLPEYMTPTAWVLLDEIPLTPNGKVDRRALPDPGKARLDTGQSFVAPQTLIEEVLAAIWKQVLGVERIGKDDNFFWLGGHSLLATRIISRVRESFQVELPLRSLFESPTLSEFSERIAAKMRSGSSLAAPPLRPRSGDGSLPLSYAQQRLWFLDQLTPGSSAYNIPAALRINAELSVAALEQALSEVVRRHEALRTTFKAAGGQPAQIIKPHEPLKAPLVDLSDLGEEDQFAEAERWRQADALRPFDLAAGPLLRFTLIRFSQHRYLFLANIHHIISDGWSMGLLMSEIETFYEAFSGGAPSPLAELEIQYADYALWQRDWLQGEALKGEIEYWNRQLDGAPTLLELETDHPRQPLRTLRGAHCPIVCSEEVSRSLREFSWREGATLFMTMMTGFQALMWRYTGQSDILVGTPIAGRGRVELEPLIGFFVNMIPLRTNFSNVPTFRQLLKQIREASFGAYAHQDFPFDKLVEDQQPKRAPGRNPLFQVILSFQNNVAPTMEMAGVRLLAGAPVTVDTKFDLEAHLWDTPDGVTGSLVYSPELFEPTMIARMASHFRKLFEKAMAEPDTELSAFSLLDEAEYRQVVEVWNDTAVDFPGAACIHEILEREAERRPDAIAVEFELENLSYRELNRQANVLAHYLRRHGVGPEVFVAVMLERSVELIVGLLSVAKAGGVYAPINLSDPPSRTRWILENAGISTLLTTQKIAENLPENGLTIIRVDADEYRKDASDREFEAPPANGAAPDNLAYLMYTSGSTGMPKGVCITHRNVLGLVKSANYADLNSEETFLQFAPVSFDASTFEIWGCLLNGARLVVFPPHMPSLSELGEFITRTQITTLFLTTGLFHQMVDGNVKSLGAVGQLLTGGEALSPPHLDKALEQFDDCLIVNCYGPTESTTMACCYRVEPNRPATSVPIGRPISNTRVYIHNAIQAAGIGERGELLIGGAGLGRGYLHLPGLTAESFTPDPFSSQPGRRLYRTGDVARYLNQGVIQFLGRLDDQVKLNGFRIELGEIQAVLSEHPALKEALVLAREDSPGDKRLVAYVVANGEAAPSNEELRSYLKERLPEYMVPSAAVILDALPLTPHGKVDRAALPAPQISLSRSKGDYVAPRNGLQQQLVEIWEELFKVHPIGVTDNFFELGGHSLLMAVLVARIEERMGNRVPMAAFFEDPTVEHLSQLIGFGKENPSWPALVPMRSSETHQPLFCPHAGGGHVMCYTDLAHYLGDDQPFYGLQAREPETGLVMHTQIEAMASAYVDAIRAFQPTGPYLLGGWSMGGVIAFEMARQLQQQEQQIALLALIDVKAPLVKKFEHNLTALLAAFARNLGLTYETLSMSWKEISALPPMAQLRQVWLEAKAFGLAPPVMTLVEFRKIFDIFKINANTMNGYVGGTYQGRVTLFRAEKPQTFLFAKEYLAGHSENPDIGQGAVDPGDALTGWEQLATEGVDVHTVPGDHYSMLQEPHVKVLAEQLRICIQSTLKR